MQLKPTRCAQYLFFWWLLLLVASGYWWTESYRMQQECLHWEPCRRAWIAAH